MAKDINVIYSRYDLRDMGEPIAYFQVEIPKEVKSWNNIKKGRILHPKFESICLEPESAKIAATNSYLLHVADVVCGGFWPEDGETPFQCFIDFAAIRELAGKTADVAVWINDKGEKVTAVETDTLFAECVTKDDYPDFKKVVPKENLTDFTIKDEDLKELRKFAKENMGKTKDERAKRWAYLKADKGSSTLEVTIMSEDYYEETEIARMEVGLTSESSHWMKVGFSAELFYYSIEGDFTGTFQIHSGFHPAKFLGTSRVTIMSLAHNPDKIYFRDTEQNPEPEDNADNNTDDVKVDW